MKLTHRLRTTATIVAAMAFIGTAFAHHSGAEFDTEKIVELKGTIKEFQFKNPHTWVQVLVPDGKGGTVEWSLEWGAPNSLGRQGIRPTTFPVGAKVVVRMNPMRSGAPGGMFIGAKLEDGKTIGTWN
jgi:hypothetical protein